MLESQVVKDFQTPEWAEEKKMFVVRDTVTI